ncbi:hypothetical protein SNEBB_000216 [Seison nebaliae]|nr:hypothetical protein SNEBB_000216 [Seison nebaliae]
MLGMIPESYGYDNDHTGFDNSISQHQSMGTDDNSLQLLTTKNPVDAILEWLTSVEYALEANDIDTLAQQYNVALPEIIKNYFDKKSLPTLERVMEDKNFPPLDRADKKLSFQSVMTVLYCQIYYRHIYATKQGMNDEAHRPSYHTYLTLAKLFTADSEENNKIHLPKEWVNDILDELLWQFIQFRKYQISAKNADNDTGQTILFPIGIFDSFMRRSNATEKVEEYKKDDKLSIENDTSLDGDGEWALSNRTMLYFGLYSLVGLLKLNSMVGDFHLMLSLVRTLRMSIYKQLRIFKLMTAVMNINYYSALTYMMTRQYDQAIQILCDAITFVDRNRGIDKPVIYHYKYKSDLIMNQSEDMMALLNTCLQFYPQRIDVQLLTDKNMRNECPSRGVSDLFNSNSLSFYLLFGPDKDLNQSYEEYHNFMNRMIQYELQAFTLSDIRSVLKLYKTMPLKKMAATLSRLNNKDITVDDIKTSLMHYKNKSACISYLEDDDKNSEPEFDKALSVDFYIDDDMIKIADTEKDVQYGHQFIRMTERMDQVTQMIEEHRNDYFEKMKNKQVEPISLSSVSGSASSTSASINMSSSHMEL